ncbi:Outer membrane protein (OmpH-like) [Polystyrenella longa]|uniref:Outer membrane protein (OmpH-like) n=1 Tax=Polystyrenella longa TaxID=2528007 RepID=A0A518CRB6_9PLAN|nr:OmpH family outer membrane protein [Polystyrenella longa]QDU81767.1 Outer membrane protein (OmpH-like) [Polystyrenella longa]
MKKLVLSITAVAVMGIILSTCTVATAQNSAGGSSAPHKIGLIDMAHIFKNYEKFKDERKQIEEDLKSASEGAKSKRLEIEKLQEILKGISPTSSEFSVREKEVAGAVADFQADASAIKRELVMKEADLYKRTYLEVTDIISKYAKAYNYTLILRYSAETVEADDGPQDVMRKMGSQVVFHQESDDITNAVLKFMNDQYKPSAASRGTGTRK